MADEAEKPTRAGRARPRAGADAGAIGRRFGPYRTVARLGAGGMGVVFRATHVETGAEVALKTVNVREARYLASLRREIGALARIRHPGIVPIRDHGLEDGVPWYAMELVEGQTLRAWTRRRRLDSPTLPEPAESGVGAVGPEPSEETVPTPGTLRGRGGGGTEPVEGERRTLDRELLDEHLSIVLPLCETLAFLHGEGIVHRDLKPDNVIVLPDRRPVLVDFGLSARFAAGRDVLDVAGAWGTLSYMAPEQVMGHAVDARADLYSLGCMMYELVTGRAPAYEDEALLPGTRKPPATPADAVDGVPDELSALIMRLLDPDPRARLGYASEVAEELRRLGARSATPAFPTPRQYLYRPDLVGRSEPLTLLSRDFGRAHRGQPRVILVGGESGVGKTRLALEFALRIAAGRALTVTGECFRVRRAPLSPLSELLRTVADRCQQGGPGETERLLGDDVALLATYEPALAAVPGAEHAPPVPPASGRSLRPRLLEALVRMCAALSVDDCLLLVLDDLQWADELTLGFLRAFAEAKPSRGRVMILGLYRSDEVSEPLAATLAAAHRKIDLSRLDERAAREMVASVLCSEEVPQRIVDSIAAHAGGNPFYVTEYVQTAVEEGLLRRDGSRWTATADVHAAQLRLPTGIRELLDHRLDRLSERARTVLDAAAVLGREAGGALLLAVSPLEENETLEGITELLGHQIVEEHEGGTRFAHDQLREAAYRRLDTERRTALHRVAALALEARIDGGAATPAELAHHFAAGGMAARAIDYLEKAGAHALRSGGHVDAARHFESALSMDDAEGRAHLGDLRRASIERRLGDAHFALGDFEAAAAHCRRAQKLLGQPSPERAAGGLAHLLRGIVRQAAHRARKKPLRPPRDEALLAEGALAAQKLAEVAYFRYQAVPLVGFCLQAANLAERAGHYPEVARAYAMLGVVVGASGMPRLASRYFELAESSARMIDDLPGLVFSKYAELAWLVGMARWSQVAETGERTMRLARELGDIHEINTVETLLGHSAYFRGAHDEALERYERVEETARRAANRQHLAWGLYARARSLVRIDRHAEAASLCRAAAEELASQEDLASEIICHGLLALACEAIGERDEADRALREACARIRREKVPTMVFTLPGYAAVADVSIGRLSRALEDGSDPSAAAADARLAVRSMRLLALTHPVARAPAALRHGRMLALSGKGRRAERSLRRALALAEELSMRDVERDARLSLFETRS